MWSELNKAEIKIRKTNQLRGTVEAPPSKSYTHRALIAASLSEGSSTIVTPLICDDTEATIEAIVAYGAKLEEKNESLVVRGLRKPITPSEVINCRNSGSTLRFITPILAHTTGASTLTGGESLRRRPMKPLLSALKQLGVDCCSASEEGYAPIVVFGGGIKGGEASLPGDVSSQFISGLLFSSPLSDNDVIVRLTSPLESAPYVEMTLQILKKHGIRVEASKDLKHYRVLGRQLYRPSDHKVPGDYSSASFILAAAALLSSKIRVKNLEKTSPQGDRTIASILSNMGVEVKFGDGYVDVSGGELRRATIDAKDTPDLVPACVALACYAEGETEIRNVRRLRVKESDRVDALTIELGKMGARISLHGYELRVKGPCRLHGATVDPRNDHRVAMACAVAALGAEGETRIMNPSCVEKSYPNFFSDLRLLGAEVED